MKIACISTAQLPSIKANSIQVMKVCQALVQNGEDVSLYVPGTVPVSWEELADYYGLIDPFPVIQVKFRRLFKRMDFTLASLRDARIKQVDLVYTRMLWVAFLARLRGLPVVLELHDLPGGRFGPTIYRRFLRFEKPKLTVYITSALKQLADANLGVQAREGEFLVAPDGVDLERFQDLPDPPRARALLGLEETTTAVYSGGFYAGRGLDIMQQLALVFPQVQFLWIGGTPEQVNEWSGRLSTAGVRNVKLTGFIPNAKLPSYQAAADVLLMPYSLAFGGSGGGDIAAVSSPMKLFEYMAAGRSILASDLPVLREVLNDRNAAFYQPENFPDLCAKFAVLISNVSMRKKLAAAAQEDVKAFSWRTRMAVIINIMKGLIEKK